MHIWKALIVAIPRCFPRADFILGHPVWYVRFWIWLYIETISPNLFVVLYCIGEWIPSPLVFGHWSLPYWSEGSQVLVQFIFYSYNVCPECSGPEGCPRALENKLLVLLWGQMTYKLVWHIEMENSMIWNGQKIFSIGKETQELLKKFLEELKGHYNIKIKHLFNFINYFTWITF